MNSKQINYRYINNKIWKLIVIMNLYLSNRLLYTDTICVNIILNYVIQSRDDINVPNIYINNINNMIKNINIRIAKINFEEIMDMKFGIVCMWFYKIKYNFDK